MEMVCYIIMDDSGISGKRDLHTIHFRDGSVLCPHVPFPRVLTVSKEGCGTHGTLPCVDCQCLVVRLGMPDDVVLLPVVCPTIVADDAIS